MTTSKFHKFWVTPIGSLVKHFLFIVLSLWLIELQKGRSLFDGDVRMWLDFMTAAFVSCLPTVMNWLNPAYKNYGK